MDGESAIPGVQANRPDLKARAKKFGRKFVSQRYLQMMVLLGVAWMIIFNYIPLYGIIIAFKEFNIIHSIAEAPWVGLKHFKEFLTDENLLYVLKNTLGMSFLSYSLAFRYRYCSHSFLTSFVMCVSRDLYKPSRIYPTFCRGSF